MTCTWQIGAEYIDPRTFIKNVLINWPVKTVQNYLGDNFWEYIPITDIHIDYDDYGPTQQIQSYYGLLLPLYATSFGLEFDEILTPVRE